MTEPDGAGHATRVAGVDARKVNLILSSEKTAPDTRLGIVIVTRNRLSSLLRTLRHLDALEDRYSIIVVDNASTDNTVKVVCRQFPDVKVLELDKNYGAVARNFGVEIADQLYIAFCDDDSWWAPGSLSLAIELFARSPQLGLLMSKILVEPGGRYDPCCRSMEDSPLPNYLNLPGFPILGFIACGTVVRRAAFRAAGGFNARFGTWGEEELLAIDLAQGGWGLAYVPEVISHHYPSTGTQKNGRRTQEVRNTLWTYWMRRSPSRAFQVTWKYVKKALKDRETRAGLYTALRGATWVIGKRNPVPGWLERQLDLKETNRGDC